MGNLIVMRQGSDEANSQERVVRLFTPRRIEIDAPDGMEVIVEYERMAERALIDYERIHQRAIDQIIEIMGNATIMRLPDGSFYERKVIQREAFTIQPEPYSALVFHKGVE